MLHLRWAAAAVLLLIAAVQATVHDLTTETFDEKVAKGVWMVEFYAPWCGHCKSLMPTWESAAATLDGVVNFAKVDCTAEPELGKRFGVRGYPTLKALTGGADGPILEYRGNRQLASIIEFSNKLVEAAVSELPDHIILALGVERTDFLFVGDGSVASKQAEEVYRAMAGERKMAAKFWATDSQWTRDHLGLARYPAVLVIKDGYQLKYTGPMARGELDLWVLRERLSTVPQLGTGEPGSVMMADLMQTNRSVVLAIVGQSNPQASQDLKNALKEVGLALSKGDSTDELAGKYTYAWVDGDKHFKFMSKFFWIRPDQLPYLLVWDFHAKRFHSDDGKAMDRFTTAHVLQFVRDVAAGKVKERGDWWDNAFKMANLFWLNFVDFYNDAPMVVALLIGLPFFFFFLACIMPNRIHPQEEYYRMLVEQEQEEKRELEAKIKEEEARIKAQTGGWGEENDWAPKDKKEAAAPKPADQKKAD